MYAIIIVSTLVIASIAHEDVPRFFTNGHGGNQFFHAALGYHTDATRRIDNDNDIEFSHNVKYIAIPKNSTKVHSEHASDIVVKPIKLAVQSAPETVFSKRILSEDSAKVSSNDVPQDLSLENQIIPETVAVSTTTLRQRTRRPFFRRITTPLPKIKKQTTTTPSVARKRIVVRKFVPQQKTTQQPEKNKKREISSSIPARNNFKFTNRHFKPLQQEQQKHKNNTQLAQSNNRSALYARKPNGKYTQMHFRRVELPLTTTETSSSNGSMHRMKEKRHLANIRFFNRRKLRS